MTFPGTFFVHTASVSTFLGSTATGAKLADPVDDACFIEDDQKLVVNASGEQVASSAVLYARRSSAALYAPGSEVTSSILPGRARRVISIHVYDSGSLGLPDHVQVALL